MKATIIADSLHSESGSRLTTVLVEGFPKGLGLQDITRHRAGAFSMDEIKDIWNDAFDCRDKCEFGPFDPSWQQLRKKYAGEHGSVRGPWDPSWRLPYEVGG